MNERFDYFQDKVNTKIENIHQDYDHLSRRFDTIRLSNATAFERKLNERQSVQGSTTNDVLSRDLRERGEQTNNNHHHQYDERTMKSSDGMHFTLGKEPLLSQAQ